MLVRVPPVAHARPHAAGSGPSCLPRRAALQGISAPFSQSALNYLLLAALYSALHARARGGAWGLTQPWWAYALLSALDVLGNGCLVFAYRYTSLTSVT